MTTSSGRDCSAAGFWQFNFWFLVKVSTDREHLKALTDHFEGGGGGGQDNKHSFLLVNWSLGYFFYLILKGLLHKISKKSLDAA